MVGYVVCFVFCLVGSWCWMWCVCCYWVVLWLLLLFFEFGKLLFGFSVVVVEVVDVLLVLYLFKKVCIG